MDISRGTEMNGTRVPDSVGRRRLPARLPPLNLFRTFDCAVRHGSFRMAAAELCVTPSAVSQQIRQLEDYIGSPLFRRLPRRVELTRDGMRLATSVREAIAMLSAACEQIIAADVPTMICVNAASALASRWLVSRLKGFMEAHPNIRVMLQAAHDEIDFRRQDIDIAIRWGAGGWNGAAAERLVDDVISPVCSPEFRDHHGLTDPRQLHGLTQLHTVGIGNTWSDWLAAVGLSGIVFKDILYFSDASLMLEAAAQGQGICLATTLLAQPDLQSGRLVRPFATELATAEGYHLLVDARHGERPAVAAFRAWIREEARKSLASMQRGPTAAVLPMRHRALRETGRTSRRSVPR
jgi:LysR family glycine cleavage system transcriptional activator